MRQLPAVADLDIDLMDGIAAGKAVTLVPAVAKFSTGQAASFVGGYENARNHGELFGDDEIPFILVGSHRRALHAAGRLFTPLPKGAPAPRRRSQGNCSSMPASIRSSGTASGEQPGISSPPG